MLYYRLPDIPAYISNMTNKKISELVEATSVNPADTLPLVQGGITKRISKQILDSNSDFGQANKKISSNQLSTVDATPTVLLSTGDIATDRDVIYEVNIQVRSGTSSNVYKRTLHIKNVSNVVSVALEQTDFTNEQIPGFNILFNVNTLAVECLVVGTAATNATWTGLATLISFT